MNNDFTISVVSDLDYEEMVADISYKNQTIGMITQEHGIDKMEFTLYPPVSDLSWKIPLDDFLQVLQRGKEILIRMQKLPD